MKIIERMKKRKHHGVAYRRIENGCSSAWPGVKRNGVEETASAIPASNISGG